MTGAEKNRQRSTSQLGNSDRLFQLDWDSLSVVEPRLDHAGGNYNFGRNRSEASLSGLGKSALFWSVLRPSPLPPPCGTRKQP